MAITDDNGSVSRTPTSKLYRSAILFMHRSKGSGRRKGVRSHPITRLPCAAGIGRRSVLCRAVCVLLSLLGLSEAHAGASASEQQAPAKGANLTITTPLRPESFLEATCPHQAAWGTPQSGIQLWRWPFKLAQINRLTVRVGERSIDLRDAQGTVLTTPLEQQLLLRVAPEATRRIRLCGTDAPCATVLELQGGWTDEDSILLDLQPVLLPMHRGGLTAEREVRHAPGQLEVRSRAFNVVFRVLAPHGRAAFTTSENRVLVRLTGPPPAKLVFVAGQHGKAIPDAVHVRELLPGGGQLGRVLDSLPDVRFDSRSFFRPLAWSAISLHRLWVVNPDMGPGLISGYGPADRDPLRPRYAWFFDEPMLANVAYTRLGMTAPVRDALRMLTRYQASGGKPVHEVTQSLRYWPKFFREFPYAYMHADSGPFFIVGHWLYWRASGDSRLISDHWPALLRAYRWCTRQVDEKSGLFVVRPGQWGGTEASIDIDRDLFTNGMWLVALRALADMASYLGDETTELEARQRLDQYAPALERTFWDPEEERFFWGYRRNGARIAHCFPQAGVPFWLGAFARRRVRLTVSHWFGPGYATCWGIRTVPETDEQYAPDSYQLGSVWPVWTACVQLAALRSDWNGDVYEQWQQALGAMFLPETNGHMPELLRGDRFQLATGAVQHQMFSHLLPVNILIDGFLGVSVHAPRRTLWLRPNLPSVVRRARARGLYFGERERFDLCYEKADGGYVVALDLRGLDHPVHLRLDLPPLAKSPSGVRVDGKRVRLSRAAGRMRVEIALSPARHRIVVSGIEAPSSPKRHSLTNP